MKMSVIIIPDPLYNYNLSENGYTFWLLWKWVLGSGQFKILHTELKISDLYSKKSFSKESQHLL